jgi:tRNA (mo5U34)-methyltransferase
MNLDTLRQERLKCLDWKNIKPYWEAIQALPKTKNTQIKLSNTVEMIPDAFSDEEERFIYDAAKLMHPWRKGPFQVSKTFIDSEWKSNLKYNLLRPHFNLKNKIVEVSYILNYFSIQSL